MKTKKQHELIDGFLTMVDEDIRPQYRELIEYLSEVGYNPYKQRSYIVFKHDLHNKQIAKTGIRINKDKAPFFALRFSACRNYPEKFAKIVKETMSGDVANNGAACMRGECTYCAGEPATHVYTYTFPNSETKTFCGAGALEIQNIMINNVPNIKSLIREENAYLLKHQAGIV